MALIGGLEIEYVSVHNLLGLTFDSYLKWKHHVNSTCSKMVKRLSLLRHIKPFLPYRARIQYYKSMVAPIMEYGCVIWGDTSQYITERIFKLQKLAARMILDIRCPTDMSTEYLFQRLNWMTFIKEFNTIEQ